MKSIMKVRSNLPSVVGRVNSSNTAARRQHFHPLTDSSFCLDMP